MNIPRTICAFAFCLLTAITVSAQPPGRGGDRGGGFGGGGPGGGPGGGDRGSRGGGPPGGGFGGDRSGGGPPGGGFGGDRSGGGPPGGGFGGSRGGGPPGGGGGDRGGGGFDPSSMLSRLDTNGNGVLDPDEQQGPAQFLISRMQQSDPSIKPGQPISLKKVTAAFEKMRGERDSGQGGSSGGPSRGGSRAGDEALEVELLVPGFGVDEAPSPLLGFGAAAELLTTEVTEADKREAAERMRSFDKNGDGVLSKNELSSRMSGNPMDFDRNKDGKLTVSELAVRYARRRVGEEEARAASRKDDRRRTDSSVSDDPPDVYNGRKSFRVTAGVNLPEGLPGFFTDKDADQDGQVTMAEFATEWSDATLSEYFRSDLNSDGVITAEEVMLAVEQGGASSTTASASVSMNASTSSSSSSSPSSSNSSPAPPSDGKIDPKLISYAERIISRYDSNKDSALTASEWGKMLMNPGPADADRDGRITINEYAAWMQSRSSR